MIPHLRLGDFKELIRPTGPLFVCIIPWVAVLIGQQAALCHIIITHYSPLYLIVIGNMATACLIAFALQLLAPKPLALNRTLPALSPTFRRRTYALLLLFAAIQLFQMLYFQGFPLLWLLRGWGGSYSDFGIPSLNGLLNALFLFFTTSLYLMQLEKKSRLRQLILGLLLIFPILTLCRQLLLALFLQITCCALVYQRKNYLRFGIFGAALLLLFCFLGNLRSGLSHLVTILEPKESVPEFLYPLLWVYAYVVTPFNNLNAAFSAITPVGTPYFELSQLTPSVFRPLLGAPPAETGFSLVHPNMTVSTFYFHPLLDFGPLWAFLSMAALQLLLMLAFRRAATTRSPLHTIKYAIYYMVTALSIFSNQLLYLPVIAQLLLLECILWRLERRRGIVALVRGNAC